MQMYIDDKYTLLLIIYSQLLTYFKRNMSFAVFTILTTMFVMNLSLHDILYLTAGHAFIV